MFTHFQAEVSLVRLQCAVLPFQGGLYKETLQGQVRSTVTLTYFHLVHFLNEKL